MEINTIRNEGMNRFEAEVEGHIAVIDYINSGDNCLDIVHTGVPQQLEGKGIAAAMTKTMLKYVRNKGMKIRAICPYTASYIQRHPEYVDLQED